MYARSSGLTFRWHFRTNNFFPLPDAKTKSSTSMWVASDKFGLHKARSPKRSPFNSHARVTDLKLIIGVTDRRIVRLLSKSFKCFRNSGSGTWKGKWHVIGKNVKWTAVKLQDSIYCLSIWAIAASWPEAMSYRCPRSSTGRDQNGLLLVLGIAFS